MLVNYGSDDESEKELPIKPAPDIITNAKVSFITLICMLLG